MGEVNRYSGLWQKEYFYVDEQNELKSTRLNIFNRIFRKCFGTKESTQISKLIRCLRFKKNLTEKEEKILTFALEKFKGKYSVDPAVLFAPNGISNFGCNCYAISTLQAFLVSPVVKSLINQPKEIPAPVKSELESEEAFSRRVKFYEEDREKLKFVREKLKVLIEDLSNPRKTTYELGSSLQVFINEIFEKNINETFSPHHSYEQQDAMDFCSLILESIGYSFNLQTKRVGQYEVENSDNPLITEFSTEEIVRLQVFPLAIEENDDASQSFYSLLQSDINKAEKSSENTWRVEYQGKEVKLEKFDITMRVSNKEPVDFICFHLKKYGFDKKSLPYMIEKKFELESPVIDLRPLLSSESDQPILYRLVSCVDHSGKSTNSGHYTSHIYKDGFWFYCNDGSVTPCTFEDVINKNNYLFMFERVID